MRSALTTLLNVNSRKSSTTLIQTSLSLLNKITKEPPSISPHIHGKALHCYLVKIGLSSHQFIAVKLLIFYLKWGKPTDIDLIVGEFNGFNLVAHNCLISASVEKGDMEEARNLFDEMPERNEVSWTALISGFMRRGRVSKSIWYFQRNPFQNVVSWTAAISGFVQNGMSFDAIELFRKMLELGTMPNSITFTSVVRACAELIEYRLGMSVFGLIVKLGYEENVSVSNSLITLSLRLGEVDLARKVFSRMKDRDVVTWTAIMDVYVDTGDLGEARRVFDEMPERNEVSWSAIISRYSQSGDAVEAVDLFRQMMACGFRNPTVSCFASVINALADLEALQSGRNLHGHISKTGIDRDVFIACSLIDLYSKCGEIGDARLVFDLISEKSVVCYNSLISGYSLNGQMENAERIFKTTPMKNGVSWNTMISGYLENEQFDKVFEVFNQMLLSGEIPNKSTFSSILCACASTVVLKNGQNLHAKTLKLGFQHDVYIGTALTDMYAKCGDILSSKKVFNIMPEKNVVSWTAMIQGLAENGFAEESLSLFEKMEKTTSLVPNELILSAVLFACSHCGLVDKGLNFFNSMEKAYNIKPNNRHYTCLADMLSRCGRLHEAEKLIKSMPFKPDSNTYAALLSGCSRYKEETIAERVVKKLWELGEKNSEGYVLLSNVYASAGRWGEVLKTRRLMQESGLRKISGCSWVEVHNRIHLFYSGDGNDSLSEDVYRIIQILKSEMMAV